MREDNAKRFNPRALATFVIALTGAILTISGILMYLRPSWTVSLSPYREVWNDLHIVMSVLFVLAAAFHITYNWKVLLGYIRSAGRQAIPATREMGLAGCIVIVCIVAVFMGHMRVSALIRKGPPHGPEAGQAVPMPGGMPSQAPGHQLD